MNKKDDKKPLIKFFQVKEYGNAWYIPLTKFLKPLGVRPGQIVKVSIDGNKVVIEPDKT